MITMEGEKGMKITTIYPVVLDKRWTNKNSWTKASSDNSFVNKFLKTRTLQSRQNFCFLGFFFFMLSGFLCTVNATPLLMIHVMFNLLSLYQPFLQWNMYIMCKSFNIMIIFHLCHSLFYRWLYSFTCTTTPEARICTMMWDANDL